MWQVITQVDLRPGPIATVAALLSAVLAGALLGLEREARSKPAGLKTHAMVALGAASFTLVGLAVIAGIGDLETVQVDPTRLISAVVAGIGFLGAGVILQGKGDIKHLTTAATIWVAAAVGVACGVGHYLIAGTTVAAAMLVLIVVRTLEHKLLDRD